MFFPFRSRTPKHKTATFRPAVCVLEDRVVPTATYRTFVQPTPPANVATHFLVLVPADVPEGTAANVVVEALNSKNQIVTGYHGAVQLSLGTADPYATLPANFTFSAADKGKQTVQVTFGTPGPQTVVATSGAVTGQGSVNVAGVVTHFAVYSTGQAVAGGLTLIQVVALDANNNIVTDYQGTVHITNSDVFAGQLPDYTFQASDNGMYTFGVSFSTPGLQTISVTDDANHGVSGSVSVNVSVLWPWEDAYYGGWWW